MKPILLFIFLLLKSIAYCQITFEELPIPPDFNLEAVRQSPIGEYFVQAGNDEKSIYSSLDGVAWTKEILPVKHRLSDIQFFSDGTPVLQGTILEGADEHLIRRNGAWYTLPAEASFIKYDTLFVYANKTFSFSLDRGMSFDTVFTTTENFNDQTSHLWKPANHFILQYTSGSHFWMAAFDESGNTIINTDFNLPGANIVYNDCGLILFYDHSPFVQQYRLITEPGFHIQSGSSSDIFPGISSGVEVSAANGHYYARDKNIIYRSGWCDFGWSVMYSNDLIDSMDHFWIDQNESVFLFDELSNHFFRNEFDSDIWIKQSPDIDYPRVFSVDEAKNNNQFVLTTNYLFYKKSYDSTWSKRDSIGGQNFQVQYAPDVDLYLNKNVNLEYSSDNCAHYSIIELPHGGGPSGVNFMQVLDDNIIFLWIKLLGEYYYTLDNGQNWIKADIPPSLGEPLVKLVNNYIMVINFREYSASRVDIITNEVSSEDIGQSSDLMYGAAIMDDGSVYFQRLNILSDKETLFRYTFGQGLKTIGHYHDLLQTVRFEGVSNDLYCFGNNSYYVYNGQNLQEYIYTGLPDDYTNLSFNVSDNVHVYATVDYAKIFRSTDPVVRTNEIEEHAEIRLFPNPASSFISVSGYPIEQDKFDSYEIVDMLGQNVEQFTSSNDQNIRIEKLTPGNYTIILKKKGLPLGSAKFVKQ